MTQRNEQHRKWAWPLGLLLSTLMMGCILLLFSLTYATVDIMQVDQLRLKLRQLVDEPSGGPAAVEAAAVGDAAQARMHQHSAFGRQVVDAAGEPAEDPLRPRRTPE